MTERGVKLNRLFGRELGKSRRFVIGLGLSLFSLLFLAYAVYREWDVLVLHLRDARLGLLGLALLLYPIGFFPTAALWHMLMSNLGGCTDLSTNLHHFGWSCLPKRIPGVVWYVASRVALYRESGVQAAVTVTATVFETLLLIFSGLLVFSVIAVTGYVRIDFALPPLAGMLGGVVVVLLVAFRRRILPFLFGVLKVDPNVTREVRFGWRSLLGAGMIGILGWIGGGVLLWLVSSAVLSIPVQDIMAFVGIWAGAGAVSLVAGFLIQGLGLREVTLAVLLTGYMPMSMAVTVAVLFRVLLTIGEFVWALLLVALSPLVSRITRREY